MALALAAVADRDDVLPAQHVLAAGQLQHQCLVERRQRQKVEAVEAFDRREPRFTDLRRDPLPAATLTPEPYRLVDLYAAGSGCGAFGDAQRVVFGSRLGDVSG